VQRIEGASPRAVEARPNARKPGRLVWTPRPGSDLKQGRLKSGSRRPFATTRAKPVRLPPIDNLTRVTVWSQHMPEDKTSTRELVWFMRLRQCALFDAERPCDALSPSLTQKHKRRLSWRQLHANMRAQVDAEHGRAASHKSETPVT